MLWLSRLIVAACYALLVGWIMFDFDSGETTALLSLEAWGFYAFVLLPVLTLSLIPRYATAMLIGAIALSAYGAFNYVNVKYYADPDGQSALIFLFVPVLQIALAGVWYGVVDWYAKRGT